MQSKININKWGSVVLIIIIIIIIIRIITYNNCGQNMDTGLFSIMNFIKIKSYSLWTSRKHAWYPGYLWTVLDPDKGTLKDYDSFSLV